LGAIISLATSTLYIDKYLCTASEPPNQCQRRAARFAHQTDPTNLQVSSPPGCKSFCDIRGRWKLTVTLQSLIKACSASTYVHFNDLKQGSDAARRITDKINEAQRRAENEQTVKSLQARVEDWKGHHLENFGDLLLDDIFVVTKSDIDREYHVFLFEKIILCCKEASPQPAKGAKGQTKNGSSILKKQGTLTPLSLGGMKTQKDTPLLLKGRIFLGNVTQAVPVPSRASPSKRILFPSFFVVMMLITLDQLLVSLYTIILPCGGKETMTSSFSLYDAGERIK
jgi:hypothetical protein